jgi:hypothetical protein
MQRHQIFYAPPLNEHPYCLDHNIGVLLKGGVVSFHWCLFVLFEDLVFFKNIKLLFFSGKQGRKQKKACVVPAESASALHPQNEAKKHHCS